MDITPEMIEAWKTLQEVTYTIKRFVAPTAMEKRMIEAVDILDNSNFMVPIEEVRNEMETAAQFLHNEENGYDVLEAERPDPAEWGDTTREDMARHQRLDADREAILPKRVFRP